MSTANPPPPGNRRLVYLIGLLVVVGLAALLLRHPVQRALLLGSILRADSPSETAFQELADGAQNPFPFLDRVWTTQKLPHRAMVATYLKENAGSRPELFHQAEGLLISAVFDVDASVRELALGTLAQQKHPAVPRLAAALLRDTDPQIRLLGLQYLRKQDAAVALPAVFALLNDPDLQVVTTADSALRYWTRQDFGVRISQANANLGNSTNASIPPANLKTIQEGVQHWKVWWTSHEKDFPANVLSAPIESNLPHKLPMADFALTDLNGKTVRFLDFKGKVVLLNFWTTWCPGCLVEIPDLIELQKQKADRLVILGISLDGATEVDEHGHPAGAHSDDGEVAKEPTTDAAEIRAKVAQFVKDKGINYPVLLDPRSEIGRRFNGGELPTNVLIDPQGNVRRRFIGGRDIAAFDSLLREVASKTAAP